MSRCVGITQRVEVADSYGERRDCLDQRWSELFRFLDLIPVPLPNVESGSATNLLDSLDLSALLLSGGNSIGIVDPSATDVAPERDRFETKAIEWALANEVPILGICRGMQMVNVFFGGSLLRVSDHVAVRHGIKPVTGPLIPAERDVNSFHNWAVTDDVLATGFVPLARHDDGSIEAFRHEKHRIFGVMWHPERETEYHVDDLHLLRETIG